MAKIALLTTGGTIASSRAASSDHVVANIPGETLLTSIRSGTNGIEVELEEFSSVGSYAFDLPLAFRLARRIEAILREGAHDGVVVTHGTDTMEESAFLADLLITSDRPAVFTGAQRHAGEADTDGPRNLLDAVRLAASPKARGLGAVVVFEQHIHAARDVTKAHTSRTDAFRSGSNGKLGEVDGEAVHINRRLFRRMAYAPEGIVSEIELVKLALGSSPVFLDFAAGHGARGIVIEAFGRGNAPRGFSQTVERLVRCDIPVVVASRCQEGIARPIYGGGSGGKDLQEAGAVFAGDLSGLKARILLSVLLGLGMNAHEIRHEFEKL